MQILLFNFTFIQPSLGLATQYVTAHHLYFSSPFLLLFVQKKKSNPAKFFSLAFLPIPATAAHSFISKSSTLHPVDSATHFIRLISFGFFELFIKDESVRKRWSVLPRMLDTSEKANLCLILEVRRCHVRDILRSEVRRKLTETEAGDYFLFTSK